MMFYSVKYGILSIFFDILILMFHSDANGNKNDH